MEKTKNIHVKLQIEKDSDSGGLTININFDKSAPNFVDDKHTLCWSPTLEEMDFINETFEMIFHRYQKQKKTITPTVKVPKQTEDDYQEWDSEDSSKDKKTPSDSKQSEEPPVDKSDSHSKSKKDDKIFVQADEETIDAIVNRGKNDEEPSTSDGEDGFIVEADEKTIIDKVLRQKSKKKW